MIETYSEILDSSIESNLAILTKENFENQAKESVRLQKDFSFQTNFDKLFTDKWRKKFKESGFKTHLYFLYVNSVQLCIQRVAKRVSEGGHFVPEDEIIHRYYAGLRNFDAYFEKYDCVRLIDTSGKANKTYLEIIDNKVVNVKPALVDIVDHHKLLKLKERLETL